MRDIQLSVPKVLHLKHRRGFCTAWAGVLHPSEVDVDVFFSFAHCFIVQALPPQSRSAAVKWFWLECDSWVSGEIVFKKHLKVLLPSLERDWEWDRQKVPTNKKPGGICMRIVLQSSCSTNLTTFRSDFGVCSSFSVCTCINLFFMNKKCFPRTGSSYAPWMPPVCTLRKCQTVGTILTCKLAMFFYQPCNFYYYYYLLLLQTKRTDTKNNVSFRKLTWQAWMLKFAGLTLYTVENTTKKHEYVIIWCRKKQKKHIKLSYLQNFAAFF